MEDRGEASAVRLPVRGRWRMEDPHTGRLAEVDVVVATPDQWAAMPQSSSPGEWGPIHLGDLVVGVKRLS